MQAPERVLVPTGGCYLPKRVQRSYFKSTRGTNQGGLVSPTLFNLIVDNVVQNWLALTVEYQLVSQEVLVLAVGRCMGLFYDDDGVVVLCNLEWLRVNLNVLIGPFHQYGLVANIAKSKAMICQPGTLWSGML